MKIKQKYGIEATTSTQGFVIVIDVLRAFSTAAYAFNSGAKKILLVTEAQEAFQLKEKDKDLVLVGEIGGNKIAGFDYGNSPQQISCANLTGKTIVLRSSSGTQGAVKAQGEKILLGSLVVAQATVKYLQQINPNIVTFLAMGAPNGPDGEEDIACSDYMAALLEKKQIDKEEIVKRVKESKAAQHALNPEKTYISPQDLECAIQIDLFSFAMIVHRQKELVIAQRFDV